jgi:hypothetical protein
MTWNPDKDQFIRAAMQQQKNNPRGQNIEQDRTRNHNNPDGDEGLDLNRREFFKDQSERVVALPNEAGEYDRNDPDADEKPRPDNNANSGIGNGIGHGVLRIV